MGAPQLKSHFIFCVQRECRLTETSAEAVVEIVKPIRKKIKRLKHKAHKRKMSMQLNTEIIKAKKNLRITISQGMIERTDKHTTPRQLLMPHVYFSCGQLDYHTF